MPSVRSARTPMAASRRAAWYVLATSALATTGALGLSAPVIATGQAPAMPRFVKVGAAPELPGGAQALGAMAPGRVMHIGFALTPRSPSALQRYATEVATPGTAFWGRRLTPAEFRQRFGPSPGAIAELERWLGTKGFHLGAVSANGLLLPASAPASRIDAAFRVRLGSYRLPDGSSGWGAAQAPVLPVAVGPHVTAVLGLDQLVSVRPLMAPAPASAPRSAGRPFSPAATAGPSAAPVACPAAVSGTKREHGWTDDQLARAYGLDGLYRAGALGKGETVAIFELEPYLASDIATFDRCYFDRSHTSQIKNVEVDGGAGIGSGSGEAVLDIENISGMAPAANMVVYEGPQNNYGNIYGSTDVYNTIVSQDRANIISTSWGLCEAALDRYAPGTREVENYLFEEAAAQGETVYAAAGDGGSDDCSFDSPTPVAPDLSVDDPASQPFVVGAGGTTLLTDSEPPSETVWNDGISGGGGGGGISDTWSSPVWQADSGVFGVANSYSRKPAYDFCSGRLNANVPPCRQVPDVSFDADELRGPSVYMASAGGWTTFGGTSESAPMWAAITAEIASSPSCAALPTGDSSRQRDLGFVSPGLYEVAASPSEEADSFNDITRGSNDTYDLGKGYPATKGYDLASGLGSPIVTGAAGQPGLAANLCRALGGSTSSPARPTVTEVVPSTGPSSGGTIVMIRGNFTEVTSAAVEFGGRRAADVHVVSRSEITAVSPAIVTPPATIGHAAGSVAVTVTSNPGRDELTSEPTAATLFDYTAKARAGKGTLPSVRAVGPSGGPVSGSHGVVVFGSGFVVGGPISKVTFGGVPGSNVAVLSDDELHVDAPPRSSSTSCRRGGGFDPANTCQVEVVVKGRAGSSEVSSILPAYTGPAADNGEGIIVPAPGTEIVAAPSEYDYAPRPTVSSITPDPGDATGSSPVTITGTGFSLLTFDWVDFGPPSSYYSQDSSLVSIGPDVIVLQPPPGPSSTGPTRLAAGVRVLSLGGLSKAHRFSYAGVPRVTAINPRRGPVTGGERLTISGNGLSDVTSVDFVNKTSPTVAYDIITASGTSLTFRAPGDAPGSYEVTPCTATGCAVLSPKGTAEAMRFVMFSP